LIEKNCCHFAVRRRCQLHLARCERGDWFCSQRRTTDYLAAMASKTSFAPTTDTIWSYYVKSKLAGRK